MSDNKWIFYLTTDDDFGLEIKGRTFEYDIRIRAPKNEIINILKEAKIIKLNESKYDQAKIFLKQLIKKIEQTKYGFSEGGNWHVDFWPEDIDDYFDFDL